MPKVDLYDPPLRDGTQMEGISLSVEDKLKITRKLDELGIHYVEGGWPGSNPKDAAYFDRVREVPLRHAKIAALGSTVRAGTLPENDPQIKALLDAHTPVVTIVGKTWDLHVHKVLSTTLDENLRMIRESVRYLKSQGKEVIYDAEHCFDGFKHNREYALATLKAAEEGGADCICLCETNGGKLPWELEETF